MLDTALRFLFSAAGGKTTGFSSGAAYTADSDVLELGNASIRGASPGVPLNPSTQLVVLCSVAPGTNRPLTVTLKASTDSAAGTTWNAIGALTIPAVKTGKFVANVGADLRPELYAAANVNLKITLDAPATTNVTNATIDAYLSSGEAGIGAV